jgi:hypothetical protein
VSILLQIVQDPGEGECVVEDDAVGGNLIVLNNLSLFVTIISRNDTIATKDFFMLLNLR